MKNKKGFLLGEHTVNIVIAVLAIIVLIGLGAKLYGIFVERNEVGKAEAYLRPIMDKIKNLESQGGGSEKYELLGPEGWVLVAWPNDETNVLSGGPYAQPHRDIPESCKQERWTKCLCFCEQKSGAALESCNKLNVCDDISNFETIVNDNPTNQNSLTLSVAKGKSLKITLEGNKLRITSNG